MERPWKTGKIESENVEIDGPDQAKQTWRNRLGETDLANCGSEVRKISYFFSEWL